MAISGEYLITAIAIAAQPYAIIVYGIERHRRRLGGSSFKPSKADAILGATVLAAIAPVVNAAWLTYSMGEPLLLAICIGFAVLDLLVALFIFGVMPLVFVAPTVLILVAAVNLFLGFREGTSLYVLPSILFFALGLRSIVRTVRRGRETETT